MANPKLRLKLLYIGTLIGVVSPVIALFLTRALNISQSTSLSVVAITCLLASVLNIRNFKLATLMQIRKQEKVEAETLAYSHKEILENIPLGVIKLDSKFHFTSVNSAFLAMLGYTVAELKKLTLLDITHPEDQVFILDAAKQMANGTSSLQRQEKRYIHKSGKIVWGRVSAHVLPSTDETEPFVLAVIEDITDARSRDEENQFILDALQIGVWKFNPIDQSLFWDKSMYRIFDVKEEDFSGHYQAWESTLTPEAKIKAVEELGQALRGEKDFDTVFEINTKSRGRRYISGRGRVLRDKTGSPTMMYGVNIDITKQKTSEIERERVSKFLEIVLKNVPSMIFVKDYSKNLSFSLLNKAGETILGLKEEQLLGKSDYDFFSKEQADFFNSKDREVFTDKRVLKIDKEEINTSNGKRFLQTFKVPTFDENGSPKLLIGISNDITDEMFLQSDSVRC